MRTYIVMYDYLYQVPLKGTDRVCPQLPIYDDDLFAGTLVATCVVYVCAYTAVLQPKAMRGLEAIYMPLYASARVERRSS